MERKEPRLIPSPSFCRYFSQTLVCLFIFLTPVQGQILDSLRRVPEVTVQAYLHKQDPFRLTGSLAIVDSSTFDSHLSNNLLSSTNSIPGVKMEERSPGSYRLSIRGSLLRSPFGVRNVKIYYDEIPLTDATGNTYLNLIDPVGIRDLTVLKGPDGSLFGANSGGVVLINPHGIGQASEKAVLKVRGGSFNQISERGLIDLQPQSKYRFALAEGYEFSKGYRQQSAMSRKFLQTTQRWFYMPKAEVRLVGFYSSLSYQTPGGLTFEQYQKNPGQARPRTDHSPSAVEQDARIANKTLWGGLIHEISLLPSFRNVSSIFGSYTDFTNPFITNYELRDEGNSGFRSRFEFISVHRDNWNVSMHLGAEWQQSWHTIRNYDNDHGKKADPQAADKLISNQHFYFFRLSADWNSRLLIEISNSLNKYSYQYKSVFPVNDRAYTPIKFSPEWMPRFALSYIIKPRFLGRFSLAKGYSVPTIAEIRASDKRVNTDIRAEKGWNYELGLRWSKPKMIKLDLTAFSFNMDNAIIRQVNAQDEEFFQNTGGIRQKGLEATINLNVLDHPKNWIKSASLSSSLSISNFKFTDYQARDENWSGNQVTGVPKIAYNNLLSFNFAHGLDLHIWHFYQSETPLNDGNSVYAHSYHLLQTKIARSFLKTKNVEGTVWAEIDNVLNAKYSLGNDINAYGGRYFNPAPPRNFALGIRLTLP